MDVQFTPQEQAFRDEVRDWLQTHWSGERKAAFDRYVKTGETPAALLEAKGLSEGVATAGGYVAPPELERLILRRLAATSPMREICQVRTIGAGTFRKPVSPTGLAAAWVAETAARPETTAPTLDVIDFPAGELYASPAATQALLAAIQASRWQPKTLLLYANHLHDNDRWPMGPAGNGIALPPALTALPAEQLWSLSLTPAQQLDKAMALAMQHDLQGRLPLKKRLRRLIQWLLAGRRWPATGADEFFRKAVRRHELFWVRHL